LSPEANSPRTDRSPVQTPPPLPELTTDRLVVRLAQPADVPAILRYHHENADHLANSRPRSPADFLTEAFWQRSVNAAVREFREDRSARFYLFDREQPGMVVGSAALSQIFRGPAHYSVLGYGVAREHEGKGLMHEGLEAVIRYAFGPMNLRRVMANYVPTNARSGALLRRLGFVVEGYARDYLLLNGRWQDHILTSLTNPDWRED
jgi:[ribosomal protein S5]-alanine N-acetyltransferase